jgi:GNAT superfamily N-acetyltransferase
MPMKVIGEFTESAESSRLIVEGQTFTALWEADPGYVEIPGLTEYRVQVNDVGGEPVVYMRWLVADLNAAGNKEGLLESLASHSPDGADWAACLARNCEDCSRAFVEGGSVALLALIADDPSHRGQGVGTPLARAFAQSVLAPHGVRAMWIKPVPLREHAETGIFKPKYDPASQVFDDAQARLQKYYQRSLDAAWTCPDYLRADLAPPSDTN